MLCFRAENSFQTILWVFGKGLSLAKPQELLKEIWYTLQAKLGRPSAAHQPCKTNTDPRRPLPAASSTMPPPRRVVTRHSLLVSLPSPPSPSHHQLPLPFIIKFVSLLRFLGFIFNRGGNVSYTICQKSLTQERKLFLTAFFLG